MRNLLLYALLLTLLSPVSAGPLGVLDPQELMRAEDAEWKQGRDVIFYAEDLETGERYAYQGKRAEERHTPFSSFKIPNLLIALETGVAADLDHPIAYDPAKRPAESYWPEDWKQDLTLGKAFQVSAAWYYQETALRVGTSAYRGYLGHFGYGQSDIPEGSDSFWLDGALKVSPREQATFLRRLLIGQLEVSPHNVEQLSKVSEVKRFGGDILHGKTGAGPLTSGDFDGPFEGWFVGWLERQGKKPVVFAVWAKAPSFESLKAFRQAPAERLLQRIGVIPAEASE